MTHPKTALFFALALLTPLTATAVPTQVNHEGYLADSVGTPVDGMRTITFGIYETKKFGSPFWTEVHEVDVVNGHYTVVLGEVQPLDGDLFIGDTLYLEVDTGVARPGDRTPMVSVPYAYRADEATSLSGGPVDATEIWVDGGQVIDTDGNWVGGTMMVDWTDLTSVPADFADGIDDVLTEAEVDTYADNNGYAYDADLFSGDWADLTGIPSDMADGDGDLLADMSCLDGDIIVWDGLALTWTCALDADSVLTEAEVVAMVTANGFALTADLATVATSGDWADLTGVPADVDTQLTEAEVDAYADNNGYALSSDLATVATSGAWSDLTGVPADADTQLTEVEVDAFANNNGYASASDIFSGAWSDLTGVPADVDTQLTEAEVDAYADNNGYALSSDLAPVATTGDWYDLVNVPADLTDGNLLADISCLDGEVLVWDGLALAWTCGLDQDSVLTEAEVDAMVADNGYITDADTFSGDWNDLINVPVDIDDGDADTLADISCSTTQVIKWNGASWACADDTVLDEADVDAFVSDNGYASASDIFSGAWSALTGIPSWLSDGDDDTVGALTCASNQVPVFNGGSWVCGDNNDASAEIAALNSDIDALLARIEVLESGSTPVVGGGILYGDYDILNNIDLTALIGYTEVTGNLYISGGVASLAGLESLTTVGGLQIEWTESLTSLDGLNNLTVVDGYIYVEGNPYLASLTGLNSLTAVSGDVSIMGNDLLTSFDGLNSLTTVGGFFYSYFNESLVSVEGLNNLTSVGNYVQILESPVASITGLSSLTTIGGYFSLSNLPLISLDGLDSLTSVGGDFGIEGNTLLTGITSLSNLTSVGGRVEITGNDALTSLDGLDSLTTVGGLIINSNDLIATLEPLNNLTTVDGDLEIHNTPLISSLSGLDSLTTVGGHFSIYQNYDLTSLSGADSLSSIGDYINFGNNYDLCQSKVDSFVARMVSLGWSESLSVYSNKGSC